MDHSLMKRCVYLVMIVMVSLTLLPALLSAKDPDDLADCNKIEIDHWVPDDNEDPGPCKICKNGEIVIDDSKDDKGNCKQCLDGELIVDDDDVPGPCRACKNGEIVIDDSKDDKGNCKRCLDGKLIVDDDDIPGPCRACENGEIIIDDSFDPGLCWKCAAGFVVYDNMEVCDDGDLCTKNDRCMGGKCIGDPITSTENPNCF